MLNEHLIWVKIFEEKYGNKVQVSFSIKTQATFTFAQFLGFISKLLWYLLESAYEKIRRSRLSLGILKLMGWKEVLDIHKLLMI